MSVLNDVEAVRALDPENMYNRIFDLPEQMTQAMKLATGWNVPASDFPDVKNIVVIGMGGSAIGGDIARSFLSEELLIPFQICRNYVLPEYVDDETLVIASSYSGNTEETLSAIEDAMERSAMIAALSTGGLLEEIAQINEIPMLKLPEGLQPRAAIGYSFVPLMMFLEKIGLVKDVSDRINKAIAHLKACRERMIEDRDVNQNPAKQLASLIYGKMPIIYGGPTLSDVMAARWKGQICENAKLLSFCNLYPEFNHNELVGWSHFPPPLKDHFIVINLRDSEDHPKVSLRMDVVKETIEKQDVQVIDIYASGETRLERMFSLLQMGDFVSYYLAILHEVNPTPVDIIENLKKEIAERSKALAQAQAQQ
ncbi:MAG: bifunctional phosphoglucose/phosphomannose isomerase [bacterium]|nr:bifunctional phosphoglucose/phosphomannose isomerase [bacterium]